MSTLVTGAAGFIGSHLIEILARQTVAAIVGLDNFNDYYDPALNGPTHRRSPACRGSR